MWCEFVNQGLSVRSKMRFFCITDGGYLISETKFVQCTQVGIGLIMLVETQEMLQQPICRSLFWSGSHQGMHQCEIVPLVVILNSV